jgi:hypothetical protein
VNEPPIRTVEVGDDLVLEFSDCSNRYFGDYHRILIEIDAVVATAEGIVRLRYQRPLRRMGVCGADTARETEVLIEQFLSITSPYMSKAGFTQKLLKSMHRPGQRLWKRLT